MYVSLDLNAMSIMHIHQRMDIVCMLAYLETKEDAEVEVFDANVDTFARFTDMELQVLYRNMTGVDVKFKNRDEARALVVNAIDSCGKPHYNDQRLELQTAHKEDWLNKQANKSYGQPEVKYFRYNPRSVSVPLESDEAMPECKQAALNIDDVTRILEGDYSKVTIAPPPRAPVPTLATPPAKPKGGVRARIWEVAYERWNQQGRTQDKTKVLAMRKGIMDFLEQEGIKRTTCSTALGDWQKEAFASQN